MHLPAPSRSALFRSLAAAVAPGGTLLIVGHAVTESGAHQHLGELMYSVDDVLADVDGEGLAVEVCESRERAADPSMTAEAPMTDVVVKATRPR
jgi:hypothetical protein